ncbi:MAG: undecaprenyl-diphosphate phosphatase [Pseudomonadota bacterium]|nr:undecaprenyl-diphosphate phosphatase [Pseudomonadota bacterium]
MDGLQVLFLALIQGLTEFLPVSSSAHLILPSQLLGWPDQGLAFDVAVHAGTLVAVMVYYRESLTSLMMGLLGSGDNVRLRRREVSALLIATLPAVGIGIAFSEVIDQYLRGIGVIATTTLLFGLLLGVSYSYRAAGADEQPISRLDHALVIGLAQALALIPGTSRSGVTITASLFLGYNLATAARFSFLMSIPVIAGALLLMLVKEFELFFSSTNLTITLIAMLVAAVSAYATIAFFVGLVTRVGMMPFVIYRVLLALILFSILVFV